MNIDVKEYAQAKLRCKLSGNASILADYILAQKEGFLFRNDVTILVTGLPIAKVGAVKKELIQRNIIKIFPVRNGARSAGQHIDFNFDFNTWRFVQ